MDDVQAMEAVEFPSAGDTCRGWLYRPETADGADVPVVVMAHGLGGTVSMGLQPFAERFAAAGFAALVFDYRHFGASEGTPRQLLSVSRQLADYRAAVAHVSRLRGVDAARIVLWGTSFSGGHAITLAAEAGRRLPGVVAAIAQCPFTDGPASVLALGPRDVLRIAPAAVADELAGLLRRPPVTVATVARPGQAGMMTAPDAWPGYTALLPADSPPPLTVAGRIGTRIGMYRPGRKLRRAAVPTFLAVCDKDTVAPAAATLRHARRSAPGVEVHRYPYGHFDIYLGEPRDRIFADELAFLRTAVPGLG